MSEVIDQAERVLGEVNEVKDFVNELRGYINTIDSMLDDILPVHWDGGSDLDTTAMKSGIDDVVMSANDFHYDTGQIESYTDRLLNAIEELEGLRDEEDEE
jgi:hypothetical protein